MPTHHTHTHYTHAHYTHTHTTHTLADSHACVAFLWNSDRSSSRTLFVVSVGTANFIIAQIILLFSAVFGFVQLIKIAQMFLQAQQQRQQQLGNCISMCICLCRCIDRLSINARTFKIALPKIQWICNLYSERLHSGAATLIKRRLLTNCIRCAAACVAYF